MILADTDAWLRYAIKLREPDPAFARLVAEGDIVCHPWIVAELSLGGVRPRTLAALTDLRSLTLAPYPDVMSFIRRYQPKGIGWVDANLLVSALEAGADILTHDDGLRRNAELHGRAARVI